MKNKRKIVIWTDRILEMYTKQGIVGGLTVQMAFWAETFSNNRWRVYSFSKRGKKKLYNGIHFLPFPQVKIIGFITEWIFSLYFFLIIKPDLIIIRGAGRRLGYVAFFSKIFRVKLIHFGASDSDYEKGKELISHKRLETIVYHMGIRNTDYFVAQNENQKRLLKDVYGKNKIVVIPNIWKKEVTKREPVQYDGIWVGNFRKLKRPEWFIQLAVDFPDYKFAMVGGALDKAFYDEMEQMANGIKNLTFFGAVPLEEVDLLFSKSKALLCTSTMEGFPNTFLQAWVNGLPIISTFDPSSVLQTQGIGIYVSEYEELSKKFNELLTDNMFYYEMQKNINEYFNSNHDPEELYNRLRSSFFPN